MSHQLVVNIKVSGCDVYVGRPSKWGNPFKLKRETDRALVLEQYREYLSGRDDLLAALPELRGKVLGCYCAPLDCHADIIAELANS